MSVMTRFTYSPVSLTRKVAYFTLLFLFVLTTPAISQADFFTETLVLMKKRFESVNDYHCIYKAYSANDEHSVEVTFRYYYKKPKMIRMETITGKYPGTIMLYDEQVKPDKVKVRVGNPFIAIMQKAIYGDYFKIHDPKVTDLGGFGVLESDWGWLIDIHEKMAAYGTTRVEKEVLIDGKPVLYYVLISANPEKTLSVAKEELWVDKETYSPVKFIDYDISGKVIRKSVFGNMVINDQLKAEFFTQFDAKHDCKIKDGPSLASTCCKEQ